MSSQFAKGSEWRIWDLHIHSPLSALNNQFPKVANGEPNWDAYVSKLEALTNISVVGITDYFTIEGYRKILEFRKQGRLRNFDLVLPNIEFRLDKLVGTSSGNRRLNYHVIFSDKITPDEIEEHFLQEFKFCLEGDPQRADLSLSVRRPNLELLGSRLKQEHAKFRDGRSDFEIGCMNATVDPAKIKEVLVNKERIFKGKYLIVLAEEHLPLLNWDGQDHHTRKVLLQGSDAIFSSNSKTALWARGEADLNCEQFRREFKSLKPCLHGSDAHKLEEMGRPCAKRSDARHSCTTAGNECVQRYSWIKANPTFEGLKQVLYEPRERIFIGDEPPRLKNSYNVIESIQIATAPDWFTADSIPLNEDLAAIIGPRGSGKSALAEVIAFAGGADLFRSAKDLQDTFLYKASRRSPANPAPITGALLSLRWKNGDTDNVQISATLEHGRDEEKVKYLPQRFVERLCAPENNKQLEEEIERVIFQRIDATERLEASNFRELRQSSTKSLDLKRAKLQRTLQGLNQSITDASARMALKPMKDAELRRKRDELHALLKNVPQVPEANKDELQQLETLTKQKQELESQIVALTEQLSALDSIETKFDVFREDVAVFNAEIGSLLERVALGSESENFIVRMPMDAKEILSTRRTGLLRSIETLRKSAAAAPQATSIESINAQIEQLRAKSQLTETKRKEYEKFQRDRKQLDDVIASLDREIKEIEAVISPKQKEENEARLERYLDSFELLKEERNILERLYAPLRNALLSSNETARKLAFVSKLDFDVARHASRGMELLDRRKALYGESEELETALKSFFDDIQDFDFERSRIKEAVLRLRQSFQAQGEKKVKIEDQLRKERTPKEFADWFFSIDDFSVTYSIKFDAKDLHLLSPGEKGVVLLLLYLEAESQDNRPLIIDQPDDNLDNVSVYPSLIEYFRARKKTRQIIIITHNPNLVVNTDAEQIFVANFDGSRNPKIVYRSGALENTNLSKPAPGIREEVCKILEGGTEAFQLRERRYELS
jgi:RecF/RecN/SMC N terminal domain